MSLKVALDRPWRISKVSRKASQEGWSFQSKGIKGESISYQVSLVPFQKYLLRITENGFIPHVLEKGKKVEIKQKAEGYFFSPPSERLELKLEFPSKGTFLLKKIEFIWLSLWELDFPPSEALTSKANLPPIFCISVPAHTKRRERAQERLSKFPVSFFAAIDGNSLKAEFGQLPSAANFNNESAYACLLSHLSLLKFAKKKTLPQILVFEDDVLPHKEFFPLFCSFQARLPKDWEMAYLGGYRKNWKSFNPVKGKLWYPFTETYGTFAYLVKESAYVPLINLLETRRTLVDSLYLEAGKIMKQYICVPHLCIADLGESTIRRAENMEQEALSLNWRLEAYLS